jgi:hypothetical protein
VVRGKLCYDPRKDSTVAGGSGAHRWATPSTWEWSRQRRHLRLQLRPRDLRPGPGRRPDQLLIGRGLSAEEAPPQRVAARANLCDEDVALKAGGTEKRYRVGGVIFANETFGDVKQKFADAMGGDIVKREGGVEVLPGVAQSVVREITDADLVVGEPVAYQPFLADVDRVNTVTPLRRARPALAEPRRADPPLDGRHQADGGPKPGDFALDLVTSQTQAQRIGEIRAGAPARNSAAPSCCRRCTPTWRTATGSAGPRTATSTAAAWCSRSAPTPCSRAGATLALQEIAAAASTGTPASTRACPATAPVDEFGSLTRSP